MISNLSTLVHRRLLTSPNLPQLLPFSQLVDPVLSLNVTIYQQGVGVLVSHNHLFVDVSQYHDWCLFSADHRAEFIPVQEWMCTCFELQVLDLLKAHTLFMHLATLPRVWVLKMSFWFSSPTCMCKNVKVMFVAP